MGISIHAPAEGATWVTFSIIWQILISIHAPAEGATMHYQVFLPQYNISIHAPAKGATAQRQQVRRCRPISIHAPAKGATAIRPWHSTILRISIHAPAKGATPVGRKQRRCHAYFNPRSRKGSDSKHTQFFRSNFRTKCAYLYFLLHYIFFTQNKQSYK